MSNIELPITQYAMQAVTIDCKIETRSTKISAPCEEEWWDAVTLLVEQREQNLNLNASLSLCGSIFDANQQNKTRLVNHFYYREVITTAKLEPGLEAY